jgi:hypothetical protein
MCTFRFIAFFKVVIHDKVMLNVALDSIHVTNRLTLVKEVVQSPMNFLGP